MFDFDILRMIRKHDALAKIARRQEQDASIGRAKYDIACAQLWAARNKYQNQQLQINCKQMSLWRTRHRTTR